MSRYPERLAEVLEDFALVADRRERADLLIELADRFREVPERVARRPFPEEHRVPRCESEAYVWAEALPDGTLKFHFAVENPQGISAKAMAVILDETLSGQPVAEVAAVPEDVVFEIFGRDISMGKGQGLTGIVGMVKGFALRHLRGQGGTDPARPRRDT
jgi:cysteine desulfuration protein SufE